MSKSFILWMMWWWNLLPIKIIGKLVDFFIAYHNESLVLLGVLTSITILGSDKNRASLLLITRKIGILNINTKLDTDVKWTGRTGRMEQLGSLIYGVWSGVCKRCTMVLTEQGMDPLCSYHPVVKIVMKSMQTSFPIVFSYTWFS